MAVIAGFGGRVRINGTALRAHHWSIDWKVEDFDVTTFENFGYGGYLPGLLDADVTIDAYYDTLDDPFAAVTSVVPGTYQYITINYVKGGATLTWSLPNVLCTTAHNETGVRDVVRLTYTGKFSGYSFSAGTEQALLVSQPLS